MARKQTIKEISDERDRWMDVEEVAQYLNLHLMTVYRMLQSGVLPARKVGGRWRISKQELDSWLETHTGGTRKQVLVVDDDLEVGRFFKRILQPERCTVDFVMSGDEAVNAVREKIYDIIFLDLLLPDIDGAKTFAQIRKVDPDATVVLVTAHPDSELVGQAMKHGAVSLLSKPLVPSEVKKLVKSVHKRMPKIGRYEG
ncbi:MAG: response regulator [Armatimonadetes bacterium]|nr:response regulator [Armatimonadota bacterium]MDW8027783.1 response regulator [Armatimonadota bacterium]